MPAAGPSELQVLLRDGAHDEVAVKLALKCEQLTIAFTKSPIQTPTGELVTIADFAFIRPNITISGTIDTAANFPDNNTTNYWGMEVLTINDQYYYVPYKNYLESFLHETKVGTTKMQLEIGDATTPISTVSADATGGSVYSVVAQQFQFTMLPGMEDRWMFTISFVASSRGKDHRANNL